MSNFAIWFLVSIATGQYIGPITSEGCHAAAPSLEREGIVCRQATTMMLCDAPDHPGAFTSCPVFDFPTVKVKP
jgi:hypothetical protein